MDTDQLMNLLRIRLNRLLKLLAVTGRSLFRFALRNPGIFGLYLLFASTGIAIGVYRYMAYLNGFDFAVFYEALYSYANFQIPDSSVRGLNFFDGDHFHPIIATLAPFFFLFQSPYTLVVLQAIIVASSVFPVYIFSKKKLGDQTLALLSTSAYTLSAGLQWMLFFDFHEILFAVPLIAWSIYFIDNKLWRPLLIAIIILALTKDELYIYISMVGVVLIVTRRNIRAGLLYLSGGIVGFLLLNKIIMPLLAGKRSYDYWSYTSYGTSLGDAIKNTLLHPVESVLQILKDLSSNDARLTVAAWFKPLFYIAPFFSPYIILAIPLMLTRFLSDHTSYSVHTFHYGATIAPIVFMAFIDSISNVARYTHRISWVTARGIKSFITMMLVASISIALFLSFKLGSPYIMLTNNPFSSLETSKILKGEPEIHKMVGRDSVMAPDTIAAHFANRDNIYTMRPVDLWDEPFDKIINPIPVTEVDYIILNSLLQLPDLTDSEHERHIMLARYLETLQERKFTIIHNNSRTGWIVLKNEQR